MADVIREQKITIKDIEEMTRRGISREVVNGQWVEEENPMAGQLHGAIAANVIYLLKHFLQQNALGTVFADNINYVLNADAESSVQVVRIPDVSFIFKDRIDDPNNLGAILIPPDLAVEIISPSERASDIRAKLNDYLRFGVREIWQIFSDLGEIVVYTGQDQAKTYRVDDTLQSSLLPDFSLDARLLFEQ